METIRYAPGIMGVQVASIGVIAASETDLLKVTDPRFLEKSQISIFLSGLEAGLTGGATKVLLRYYFSFDEGVTWYQVPVINQATGEVVSIPDEVDSNTPAAFVRDIPASTATAFKVTGQTDAGTSTLTLGTVMFRDN